MNARSKRAMTPSIAALALGLGCTHATVPTEDDSVAASETVESSDGDGDGDGDGDEECCIIEIPLTGGLDDSCIVDVMMLDPELNPAQIPYVHIDVDGQPIPLVEECEVSDGWAWIDVGSTLSLCGSSCDLFRAGSSSIELVWGCPPVDSPGCRPG